MNAMDAQVHAFFDAGTSTISYVLFEGDGGECAIVDPVLDYDPSSGRTSTVSADRMIAFVRSRGLKLS